MGTAWLAGLAVTVAMCLRWPPMPWVMKFRLQRMRWPSWSVTRSCLLIGVGVAFAVGVAQLPFAVAIWAVTAGFTALFGLHQLRRRNQRAAERAAATETAEMVEVLAASVRSGMSPRFAMVRLGQEFAAAVPLMVVARTAGDMAVALRALSRAPGRQRLGLVASAWTVAEQAGTPWSVVLDQVAENTRQERELDRELSAIVAPARSTGLVMAVLPVLGLLLSTSMGVDPLTLFTTQTVPALSASLGVGLACVGVWWIDQIVRAAELSV